MKNFVSGGLRCDKSNITGLVVVPYPGSHNHFFVFSAATDTNGFTDDLQRRLAYTVLETTPQGLSVVVLDQQMLPGVQHFSQRQTAVRHANGRDWWHIVEAITPRAFYATLITPQGIGPTTVSPSVYGLDFIWGRRLGNIVAFPSGDSLLVTHGGVGVYVYSFDRCSGSIRPSRQVFNSIGTFTLPVLGNMARMSCISRNSRYAYVGFLTVNSSLPGFPEIIQLDLLTDSFSTVMDTVVPYDWYPGQLALGPDNRIYLAAGVENSNHPNGDDHSIALPGVHVIHYPDSAGAACQLETHSMLGSPTPFYTQHALPHFPDYRLGAVTGAAAHAGADTSIQPGGAAALGMPPAPNPNLVYSWSPATGLSCTACPSPTASPLVSTTYTLTVTDTSRHAACNFTEDTVRVCVGEPCGPVAAPEAATAQLAFTLYPNPAAGLATLRRPPAGAARDLTVSLYDAAGRTVSSLQWPAGAEALEIETRALPPGVYHIAVGGLFGTRLVVARD